jgi:hypothetical protein
VQALQQPLLKTGMKDRYRMAAVVFAGASFMAASGIAFGSLQPHGTEFQITRRILGDQMFPILLLEQGSGLAIWQSPAADGNGLGIAAARLRAGLQGTEGETFAVNAVVESDQEQPAAALLPGRQAVVVWQSGRLGFQKIRGRLINLDGSPVDDEFAVSTGDGEHQIDPAVAVLRDGTFLVAWSSYRQNGSYQYDVYGRIFSSKGLPLGEEFRINERRFEFEMGRRNPAVVATVDGSFMVAYIAEREIGVRDQRGPTGQIIPGGGGRVYDVGLVSRRVGADGSLPTVEQRISATGPTAAHPSLAAFQDGRLFVAWTSRSEGSTTDSLDVFGRVLSSTGVPIQPVVRINSHVYGDQYRPRLTTTPRGLLAVWSSMGQDGSWEGVFAKWIDAMGRCPGDDIQVNSVSGGGQLYPTVTADEDGNIVAAWSSNMPTYGYEIFAQRLEELRLQVLPVGNGLLNLSWPSVPNAEYQVQFSRDGKTWLNQGSVKIAMTTRESMEVALRDQVHFFRVLRVR